MQDRNTSYRRQQSIARHTHAHSHIHNLPVLIKIAIISLECDRKLETLVEKHKNEHAMSTHKAFQPKTEPFQEQKQANPPLNIQKKCFIYNIILVKLLFLHHSSTVGRFTRFKSRGQIFFRMNFFLKTQYIQFSSSFCMLLSARTHTFTILVPK